MLTQVDGVDSVEVDLENAEAIVGSSKEIELENLQKALKDDGGHYSIRNANDEPIEKDPIQEEAKTGKYYCPMHCEGDKMYDKPGDCPVCGMDLVPEVSGSLEDAEKANYDRLKKKLWVSITFTVPVFIIAMSEMIPGNPLYTLLDISIWNWLQFFLTIPVVFYSTCQKIRL